MLGAYLLGCYKERPDPLDPWNNRIQSAGILCGDRRLGSPAPFGWLGAFVQVPDGVCALRYDNECGKGDHRHTLDGEARYRFLSRDRLFADFDRDIRRFMHEDRHT